MRFVDALEKWYATQAKADDIALAIRSLREGKGCYGPNQASITHQRHTIDIELCRKDTRRSVQVLVTEYEVLDRMLRKMMVKEIGSWDDGSDT